ncbi:sigma-70 family RNA polymerase sigma factor [Thermoleptolyngbya sp. C42_A2020_037]|uniref:sigma-70 family RNA polymerase sigma factor n=1 Tax=Thermoleptolyngbya sp. C42_A2020_037 TaxID=2747799 RepID=UPI001A0294CD|nr:sigma-70 family RNA polymerase sigma factor [Thermoleptolyngbya sp. C42_A2020_037]MBF2087164.1 sigma-70 family RNA polymerase sigma factor [Thermoleptolyngbya sp. C42_A2020_037]
MPPQPSTSEEAHLLARIAQQDESALSTLYDRYARVLYSLAFRILGSVEEAEEIVLDVFSQVWKLAGRYDPQRGRVDAWLFMLTRSRSLDRLRSLQRVSKVVESSTDAIKINPQSQISDPTEDVLISERRERVLAAMQRLPVEQREVIELAYYQGLTHVEIAAKTEKSLGTVKTRIRLGLNKLRQLLDALDWLE